MGQPLEFAEPPLIEMVAGIRFRSGQRLAAVCVDRIGGAVGGAIPQRPRDGPSAGLVRTRLARSSSLYGGTPISTLVS